MNYIRELRAAVGHRPLVIAIAAVILTDDESRVLLQRRGDDGSWGLPGGMLEPGESFEEAARRELAEETSLTVSELRLVDTYSGPGCYHKYPNGDECYLVGGAFEASASSGIPTPDGLEGLELRYVGLDELPPKMVPVSRHILERYRRRRDAISQP